MESEDTNRIQRKLQELHDDGIITSREFTECMFAEQYERNFNHGTDGHIRLILISKLLKLLVEGKEHVPIC